MDFDLTRAEAQAGIPNDLLAFAYHRPLAAWPHDSGAWLCVEHVTDHPHVLIVLWRAVPFWRGGTIMNVGAFEEANPDIAWARALDIARTAWERGPKGNVLSKASDTKGKKGQQKSEAGTLGGQKSGETRAANAEAKREAQDLAKRYDCAIVPDFDPRTWIFNPTNFDGNPVINFTWKKQSATYAYMKPGEVPQFWEIGRGWFPGMNDDNARIEEVCFKRIGMSADHKDLGVITFERLLKTDPEKWLRDDFTRFAPSADEWAAFEREIAEFS